MGERIARNGPLKAMRKELGLGELREVAGTTGIEGAAVGYCQGLFKKNGAPDEHTTHVMENLREVR